jgi:hypothetical protein
MSSVTSVASGSRDATAKAPALLAVSYLRVSTREQA